MLNTGMKCFLSVTVKDWLQPVQHVSVDPQCSASAGADAESDSLFRSFQAMSGSYEKSQFDFCVSVNVTLNI